MSASVAALDLYGHVLQQPRVAVGRSRPGRWLLRAVTDDGTELAVPLDRWMARPDRAERRLLASLTSPVLDIGCGPGRLVVALQRLGATALGVDIAPAAVRVARDRGARVLERSVFQPMPLSGLWASALLLDGNVGIGGDPAGLLTRVSELLRPGGTALVELEPPGVPPRELRMRLELAGTVSHWFPWAQVGVDDVGGLAKRVGFDVRRILFTGERWFADLVSHDAA